MIVLKDQLAEAYKTLVQDASNSPVLIFVAPDCDSLGACHILTSLLKMDKVPYNVKPVASYEELKASAMNLLEGDDSETRLLCMINCGGTVGLRKFLNLAENVRVYIFDSHRPYHLENVAESNTQILVMDESTELEEFPDVQDLYSSDDEDEEEEEEEDEEDDELEEYGENESRDRASKRIKRSRPRASAEERESQRQKLMEYYRGSYYGLSCALLTYNLSQLLSRDDNDMLW
jgi:cell division control protein 45